MTLTKIQKLTDNELRKRIGALCGAGEFVGLMKKGLWWMPNSCGYTGNVADAGRYTREEAARKSHVRGDYDDVTIHELPLPNYPADLNAVHSAVSTLTGFQADLFADYLTEIIQPYRIEDHDPIRDGAPTLAWHGVFQIICATPRQLAEAFVATMEGAK